MASRVHTLVSFILVLYATAVPRTYSWFIDLVVIPRQVWGARPPADKLAPIPVGNLPLRHVFTHHTASDDLPCSRVVKQYQDLHTKERRWKDIGYNFLIDPEGTVYEGRGWGIVGDHVPGYDDKSVGILFIRSFNGDTHPTVAAQSTLVKLIAFGIITGKISEDYELHRDWQGSNNSTERPGSYGVFGHLQKFSSFKIRTWDK